MKIKFSLVLALFTMSVLSQNETPKDGRSNQLSVKIYGGISPLLSDEAMVTTPSPVFFDFKYDNDPGYNVGINIGYFLTNNIALQVGFERKENRIFLTNFPGPFGSLNRLKTNLNSNILFISSNYYFLSESNFYPYIGIGGALLQDANYDFLGAEANGSGEIGLRGLVGINYHLNSKFALNFEMNYTVFNDIELEDRTMTDFQIEYNPLTLNLGIVYTFDLSKEKN